MILLVIDIQKGITDERLYDYEGFIERTTRLIETARNSQVETELMIIGLQTNFCIDATVKSAFERGFKVYIPEGTNSTFDNDYMDAETTYRYYNEMMWPKRFARCDSCAACLYERQQDKTDNAEYLAEIKRLIDI